MCILRIWFNIINQDSSSEDHFGLFFPFSHFFFQAAYSWTVKPQEILFVIEVTMCVITSLEEMANFEINTITFLSVCTGWKKCQSYSCFSLLNTHKEIQAIPRVYLH